MMSGEGQETLEVLPSVELPFGGGPGAPRKRMSRYITDRRGSLTRTIAIAAMFDGEQRRSHGPTLLRGEVYMTM
jgi:hypothetical protein